MQNYAIMHFFYVCFFFHSTMSHAADLILPQSWFTKRLILDSRNGITELLWWNCSHPTVTCLVFEGFIWLETRCSALNFLSDRNPTHQSKPKASDEMSVHAKHVARNAFLSRAIALVPDWVATEATEMVCVSTVAFLEGGCEMEALEERVGLTLQERPFSSFFTSSSSVPARASSGGDWRQTDLGSVPFLTDLYLYFDHVNDNFKHRFK